MADFKAKMYRIRFPLELCPRLRWDPAGGAYIRSRNPLDVFKRPISKGREKQEEEQDE